MAVAQDLMDDLEPAMAPDKYGPGCHPLLASLLDQVCQNVAGLVFDLPKHHDPVLFHQHEEHFFGHVQGGQERQFAAAPLRQPDGATEQVLGDGGKGSPVRAGHNGKDRFPPGCSGNKT